MENENDTKKEEILVPSAAEVAQEFFERLQEKGFLLRLQVALQLRERFGSEFTEVVLGGVNLKENFLSEFRKLYPPVYIYSDEKQMWTKRDGIIGRMAELKRGMQKKRREYRSRGKH